MSLETIEARVKEIVAEQLGISSDEVRSDSTFVDDLGADDLDFMEIVMAFEEEFEVDIDDEDAECFESVQDAIDSIASRSN